MSQGSVKQLLKAPSTAEFPWRTSAGVGIASRVVDGHCVYAVRAYVDAQNGFGAQIRLNYTALMKRTNGGWRTLAVDVE